MSLRHRLSALFLQQHDPKAPRLTSMVHPMELYIGTELLIDILEQTIANIRENLRSGHFSDADREDIARDLLPQREELLAWLRAKDATREPNTYMAIYPVFDELALPPGQDAGLPW